MDMTQVYNILIETIEKTNKFEIPALQVFVCMLLEEGCKAHAYNMMQCVQEIVDAAQFVNDTAGEY